MTKNSVDSAIHINQHRTEGFAPVINVSHLLVLLAVDVCVKGHMKVNCFDKDVLKMKRCTISIF